MSENAADTAPAALSGPARAVVILATLAAVGLAIHQLFNLRIAGVVLIEGRYLYLLGGIFLAMAFLVFPLDRRAGARWHDWALAVAAGAAVGWFAWTAETSLESGWEYAPPETAQWLSVLVWALILEATRRAGGTALFAIVVLVSLYPTFADRVPDPLNGFSQPFWDAIPYHILSAESSFGIPMKAFGNLVIGFILFGAVLQKTGGGKFFNDLALALVGRYRGGAAKVAIFASGFMGSMSGSVISNVLTTGAVSIPAMKKTGFEPRYAAATEACASTGGVLMPPIMGATAFVMASFLSRPYVEIALAAAIPSLLYYLALFVQVDAYAARRGLRGMTRDELPSMRAALAEGWVYIAVFAVLIFMMVGWRIETLAPFYATALLLLINQAIKGHRFTWRSAGDLVVGVGRALAELTAVLLGVGLIVGAFSATGLAGTLVNDLVFMAGDSTLALLLMGALTAFVFGMGMTVTAVYIFLAVVLAPALEQAGLNQLAVHLFIIYWGMVSFITPPVALGAFAAATLAGTTPFRAGWEAMRLGGILYVVPFFFVLNPALVGQAPAGEVVAVMATAIIGVWFIGSALQGHLSLIGGFGRSAAGYMLRLLLGAAGLFFAAPGSEMIGLGHWELSGIGLLLAVGPILYARSRHREAAA
ncbi:TRAP transporter fused permease subunit [Limibaculum sp. FT325]|uniref:TRAP transporter permease n=1 Tax=Thermohalobaculum sediminis TaxID=2939436 RepID=UPI0020C129D3|nr:TRAP transporter fused permease subunit [Limibaculum sediminis]MCL5775931.1 TRAP transporter fused permease subunit [Limibaculum sediminis]